MDQSEVRHFPKTDYTPAELDRVSRLLLRAAEIIETRGHCKGEAQIGDAHCLSGAVSTAALEAFNLRHDEWALWHGHPSCMERIQRHIEFPVSWNDHPERTPAEVVAKLRAVALAG